MNNPLAAATLLALAFGMGWFLKAARDWFRGYNLELARGRLAFQQDYVHDQVAQQVADLKAGAQ